MVASAVAELLAAMYAFVKPDDGVVEAAVPADTTMLTSPVYSVTCTVPAFTVLALTR